MKKMVFIASALACTVMLTSCRATNMAKKYKANLDRNFDGGYSLEQTEKSTVMNNWTLSYTDGNGTDRETQLSSAAYFKSLKDQFEDQKQMDNCLYYLTLTKAMGEIAEDEFFERFVVTNFNLDKDTWRDSVTSFDTNMIKQIKTDDWSLKLEIARTAGVIEGINEAEYEYIKNAISPENGVKITETDLKSVACDRGMYLMAELQLGENADEKEYLSCMTGVIVGYEEYTGSPMNYGFVVTKGGSELYSEFTIDGQPVNYAEEAEAYVKAHPEQKCDFSTIISRRVFGK